MFSIPNILNQRMRSAISKFEMDDLLFSKDYSTNVSYCEDCDATCYRYCNDSCEGSCDDTCSHYCEDSCNRSCDGDCRSWSTF